MTIIIITITAVTLTMPMYNVDTAAVELFSYFLIYVFSVILDMEILYFV